MKTGDERDVVVTFPENYVEALAGKEATFKVTVKSVKEPELPELDDELAKDISDYETIAEYRDHVREDLEKEFTEKRIRDEKQAGIDRAFENAAVEKAAANMTVEIPEPMILAKLDEQLRNYISTMGISPELTREQVLASMGLDEKTFQEIMRRPCLSCRPICCLTRSSRPRTLSSTTANSTRPTTRWPKSTRWKSTRSSSMSTRRSSFWI